MVPFARLDPALRGIVNIVQTRLLEKGKERETLGMAGISWHRSHGVDSGVLFVQMQVDRKARCTNTDWNGRVRR